MTITTPTTADTGRNWLRSMGDGPMSRVEGVFGSQHSPMLRRYIIARTRTKERFERHKPPQHPQKYTRLLGRSSPINLMCRHEAQCLVWGVQGTFPPLAAMVVMLFCSVPEHEPLFFVEPQQSGYRQKALVLSKTILALY